MKLQRMEKDIFKQLEAPCTNIQFFCVLSHEEIKHNGMAISQKSTHEFTFLSLYIKK